MSCETGWGEEWRVVSILGQKNILWGPDLKQVYET
jgi:hypothetical protein